MSARYSRMWLLLMALIFCPSVVTPGVVPTAEPAPDRRMDSMAPSPELEPGEVVRIQLEALRRNDEKNEGIAVAYRFASPRNKASTGPLPRFIRMIKTGPYRLMLEFEQARYAPTRVQDGRAVQRVTLVGSRQIRTYDFLLQRQAGPPCNGCWMTESVLVVPGPDQVV